MSENESLQDQAKDNDESSSATAPTSTRRSQTAVVDAMLNHSAMSEKLLEDKHLASEFVSLLLPDLYQRL